MTKNDLKKLIKECIEEMSLQQSGARPSTDPDSKDKAAYNKYKFKVGDKIKFYDYAFNKERSAVIVELDLPNWRAILKTPSREYWTQGIANLKPI